MKKDCAVTNDCQCYYLTFSELLAAAQTGMCISCTSSSGRPVNHLIPLFNSIHEGSPIVKSFVTVCSVNVSRSFI
jgi:hypothetical protein